MEETKQTATDTIVKAMERADDMAVVLVVYKLRDELCGAECSGVGWESNATTFDALAMLEMAKHGLLSRREED